MSATQSKSTPAASQRPRPSLPAAATSSPPATAKVEDKAAAAITQQAVADDSGETITAMTTMGQELLQHATMLDDLFRANWELPMSKDTAYQMGQLRGSYALVVASLERDTSEFRNSQQ